MEASAGHVFYGEILHSEKSKTLRIKLIQFIA
jgi:hypothetical protein